MLSNHIDMHTHSGSTFDNPLITFWPHRQCMPRSCDRINVYYVWCWQLKSFSF